MIHYSHTPCFPLQLEFKNLHKELLMRTLASFQIQKWNEISLKMKVPFIKLVTKT